MTDEREWPEELVKELEIIIREAQIAPRLASLDDPAWGTARFFALEILRALLGEPEVVVCLHCGELQPLGDAGKPCDYCDGVGIPLYAIPEETE